MSLPVAAVTPVPGWAEALRFWFRLGFISFGGPAGQIALMHTEDYREGVPVIMNLSELEDADAKRIIDFAAGLVFGLRGSIERITNKVFLLSPVNVDVGDEARAQIAKDGFFNQS